MNVIYVFLNIYILCIICGYSIKLLGLVMCGCLNFCYISKLCYDGELKLIKFNFIYVFIYFEIIC